MARYLFPLSVFMQLSGFILVSKCLYSGLMQGDYAKTELYEFLVGMVLFYFGLMIKKKTQGN